MGLRKKAPTEIRPEIEEKPQQQQQQQLNVKGKLIRHRCLWKRKTGQQKTYKYKYKNIFAIGSTQQQMMIISYFPSSSSTRYHSISVSLFIHLSLLLFLISISPLRLTKCV